MAGMQSGQHKAAAGSRLPKETGAAAQEVSRPVPAQASQVGFAAVPKSKCQPF